MSLADAFAEHDARYKAQVMYDTWGHLDPRPGVTYPGEILFCYGCYRDITIIRADFDDLDGGPLFYALLHEFVGRKYKGEAENIYLWRGYFRLNKTTEGGRFVGKVRKIKIPGQTRRS
jgi:hypothetical protein